MKLVFFLGLFLAITAFSFGQGGNAANDQKTQQKKEQRVKVLVSHNGKETKIDTTFNLADDKQVQFKVDSILKKYGKDGASAGDKKFLIIQDGKKITHAQAGENGSAPERFDVFFTRSDSGKGGQHMRKVIRLNQGGEITTIDNMGDDMMMPPPPPPPPPFHMKSFKFAGGDPFAMDPDNKDIISYDKKDIGKGLEKITIVRKKIPAKEQMNDVEVNVEVTDDKKK